MDKERRTPWLTLLANVGASVGLSLVVLQQQQNRALMRAQRSDG